MSKRRRISATGVRYVYPDGTEALHGVDIEVAPGDVVALVGGNEAGKSTLLQVVAGELTPTAGQVKARHPGWLVPAIQVDLATASALPGCSYGPVTPVCEWDGILLADSVADATANGQLIDGFHGELVEARQRGIPALLATHMTDTADLADGVVMLGDGKVVADGDLAVEAGTHDRIALVSAWADTSIYPSTVTGAAAGLVAPATGDSWVVLQDVLDAPEGFADRVQWVVVAAATMARLRHRYEAVCDRLAGPGVDGRRRLLEGEPLLIVGGSAIARQGDVTQVHVPADDTEPPATAAWTSYTAGHPLALSPAECGQIIDVALGIPDAEIRHCHGRADWWVHDHLPAPLGERLGVILNVANHTLWRLGIDSVQIEVLRYQPGAYFGPHTDWLPGSSTRKLAAIIPLTDDHDGGQLQVRVAGRWHDTPTEPGSVTVVPGWTEHRVTKVTAGERWSLVAWAYGPPLR